MSSSPRPVHPVGGPGNDASSEEVTARAFAVIYAKPSGENHPGHMVVGQEATGSRPSYFGFRFDPDDLPEGFRSPDRFRAFLFENTVPGLIEDETDRTLFILEEAGWPYEKRADCEAVIWTHLPPPDRWRPHARYSFNPDDFHTVDNPCYNCVTWATGVANRLVPGLLTPVPQGRVKLIVVQLQRRLAPQEGTRG